MILVSDFDNTLYTHDDEATFAKNLEAVRKFREVPGNEFVLASGRSLASLGRVLPDFADYMKYVILDNGAVCAEAATGKVLLECSMSADMTLDVVQTCVKAADGEVVKLVYYGPDGREHAEPPERVTKLRCWTQSVEISRKIIDALTEKYRGGSTARLTTDLATDAVATEALAEKDRREITAHLATGVVGSTIPWVTEANVTSFLDILPSGAGKDRMILQIREKFFPEQTRIVTVGDSYNDIDMLKAFEGYAMSDAVAEAKASVASGNVVGSVAELVGRLLG